MKRFDPIRAAVVVAGLGASQVALAAPGGMTSTGWMSLLAVPVIVAVLYVLHKKLS
jgi:hypothetical protein